MPPIDQQPTAPNNAPAPTQPADDLPLAITRAIESVERGEPVPAAPATEPSRPADAPPSAAEGGTPTQPRDPTGRFAPKPAPEGTTPVAAPGAPPAPGTPPTAATESVAAPASWKEDAKARWNAVPPEVRAEVHRREKDLQVAMDASARRAQAASVILDEFVPYAEILEAENTTPIAAIRTLLQTAYALRAAGPEYRKSIFLDLAQQYGVDLTTGINPAQAQAEATATQYEIDRRTMTAYHRNAEEAAAAQAIQEFASTHEHFPKVREIMGNLMATGVCRDMETAYNQALVLSPEMRPMLIEQEVNRRMQANAGAAQQTARRAAAASSVGNDPGGGYSPPASGSGGPNAKDDLRGAIANAIDRIGGV